VDLCILLGCDYCDPIKGIGPQTALRLIREHHSIDAILEAKAIDTTKHPLPERYPYADARELFLKPNVADPETLEIKWGEPDVDGLVDFLVREKGFSEDRVRVGAARLSKGLKTKQQGTNPPRPVEVAFRGFGC
jgi:flap endonuclease-1